MSETPAPINIELNEAESTEFIVLALRHEQRVNRRLHQLLAKEQAASAEWQSKYLALLSHVKGPAVDDDTSPPGGE